MSPLSYIHVPANNPKTLKEPPLFTDQGACFYWELKGACSLRKGAYFVLFEKGVLINKYSFKGECLLESGCLLEGGY